MVSAQQSIVIEVDLLFVMARTVILNWEIPIGVPGLGSFGFKKILKDTGLLKSTKSAPLADFYDHFLENPDWRMAACITMGYRRLTDHQNELPGEAHSGSQLTTTS